MSLFDEISGSQTLLDQHRLATPEVNKPSDFAAFSLSGGASERKAAPKPPSKAEGYMAALQGGMNAGSASGAGQATDGLESAVSIGSSVAAGAMAGGLAGSTVPGVGTVAGAAVGAGAALLTSGAQAWMSVRAHRRRRRELEALRKEAREREERERAERMADKAEERKLNALSGAADAYERNKKTMLSLLANNREALRLFVKDGF